MKKPTKFEPIWHDKSRIFAVQQEGPNGELSSITYSGLQTSLFGTPRGVVRRLEILPNNQLKIHWEYQFSQEHFEKLFYGPIGELLLLPGERGGVIAIRLESGERVWEIGYEVPLAFPPSMRESKLLLSFSDRCHLVVDPVMGVVLQHEKAANDDIFQQLVARGNQLFHSEYSSSVKYKNVTINAGASLTVEARHTKDASAIIPGSYPIEYWNIERGRLELFGDKLVVYLEKEAQRALGVLSLPSMEPFRLLPLGEGNYRRHENYRCQDLLVVKLQDNVNNLRAFLVDPRKGCVAAFLRPGKSHLFLFDHRIAWSGKL
jgi:hypothetical protein